MYTLILLASLGLAGGPTLHGQTRLPHLLKYKRWRVLVKPADLALNPFCSYSWRRMHEKAKQANLFREHDYDQGSGQLAELLITQCLIYSVWSELVEETSD